MKSKKLGILLLLLLAFTVTTGTFAYWAAGVTGPANTDTTGTITIGTGETVTTSYTFTSTTDSGSGLVPSGFEDGSTTFATLPLNYELQWTDNGEGSLTGSTTTGDVTITVAISSLEDDGTTVNTTLAQSLITVTPDAGNASSLTLNAAATTFTWNVTMSEPANQTDYNSIQGSTITITFTWAISNVSTS
jgi:hypothetical protein